MSYTDDLPPEVIDVHCRIGDDRTVEAALREMDSAGVSQAWVCPKDVYAAVRNVEGNSQTAQLVRAYAGRFVGCAVANPWYGKDALVELERALGLGLKVLCLLPPVQGFQLSDHLVDDLVRLASERGTPIYAHTGTPICSEPFQLAALARRHPRGKFIMGHMGFADFWTDAAVAAMTSENIYLETSLMDGDVITEALRKLGSRRLVFGSDAPISDVDVELRKIRSLPASPQEIGHILAGNAKEILA